jgi:hypothetical protein
VICFIFLLTSHPYFNLIILFPGLYEDTYEDDITYTALAGRITHWTKLLPQAVPVVIPRHNKEGGDGPVEWVNVGPPLDRVRATVRWGVEWLGAAWRERFGGGFEVVVANSDKNNSATNDTTNTTNTEDIKNSPPKKSTVTAGPTTPQSDLPFWERDVLFPFPRGNMEPFIGSKLDAPGWDRGLFVVSGLYALMRGMQWLLDSRRRERGRD